MILQGMVNLNIINCLVSVRVSNLGTLFRILSNFKIQTVASFYQTVLHFVTLHVIFTMYDDYLGYYSIVVGFH